MIRLAFEVKVMSPISSKSLSVVIPVYNEQGNIGRLIEETVAVVPEGVLGEVIVVDDASEDGTGAEIEDARS